jgi:hypothetical protein
LRWDESLVLMKRMAGIDIETRSSFIGVDAGYAARLSKLEAERQDL